MPLGHWKTSRNTHRHRPPLQKRMMRVTRCRTSPSTTLWRPCGIVRQLTIQCSNGPQGALTFQKAMGVALHHVPWMYGYNQESARTSPFLLEGSGGSRPTEARAGAEQSGGFKDTVVSCAVSALPSIMEIGLLPTTGAGSDQLLTHFGVPVPGVNVALKWLTASS